MIATGMEMRRLGLARKPMYAVPNHMLGQFTKEFYEQYPGARIAVADDERFHTSRRKQFMANVAQDDSEKAIMAKRSAFTSNPTRGELRTKIADLKDDKPSRANVKAITALQNRLDNRIKQGNIISQARRIQTADESSNRKLTALQKLQADIKSHDAATARAIETKLDSIRLAIIAQQAAAQVGVVVKTILDGRTLAANLGRYTSTTTGSRSLVGTGPTSGSGI